MMYESYETSAQSISNFMRWAEQRLAQEVDLNEGLAKNFEESKKELLGIKTKNRDLSDTEKILLIQAIHKHRDRGLNVPRACELVGIHRHTYSRWRNELKISRYKKNNDL